MRSALAICWRISADGRRSPRSIWLRYGLEMPASSESRRSESRAEPRCSRMKEPRSSQRSLGSVLTLASVPPPRVQPVLLRPDRRPRSQLVRPLNPGLGLHPLRVWSSTQQHHEEHDDEHRGDPPWPSTPSQTCPTTTPHWSHTCRRRSCSSTTTSTPPPTWPERTRHSRSWPPPATRTTSAPS